MVSTKKIKGTTKRNYIGTSRYMYMYTHIHTHVCMYTTVLYVCIYMSARSCVVHIAASSGEASLQELLELYKA